MGTANVHEAKTNLSKLLDSAERGEEVFITRRGSGVNRFAIVPAPLTPRTELFGALRGKIVYAPDHAEADGLIADAFGDATQS